MRGRDRVTMIGWLAALTLAIFAVSGLRWAQVGVALSIAVALVAQLPSRRTSASSSPLIIVLALAATLTFLQLLPLPHSILQTLNPSGIALRDDGAALLNLKPWQGITLDAPGTLRSLAFFITLLAIAIVSLRMATSERGRYKMLASIAILCGLCAVVVGVHWLFGATRLYGWYEPHAQPHLLTPLINTNHFGCLMAIGAVTALGLAMYRRQRSWLRVTWMVIVGTCGTAAVAAISRGAVLGLIGGLLTCVAAYVGQVFISNEPSQRRPIGFLTRSLPIAVVAVCGVIVMLYASASGVGDQLSKTTFHELHEPRSKFAAWYSASTLIKESPFVGVGRGAFEPAFTRVHAASAWSTFSHVENEYVQAVVDWGIPGAFLLGVAGIWLGIWVLRRWRDGPLTAGAIGALAVVALQSNVDFGTELLGIAAPITAIVATLAYVPLSEESKRRVALARGLRALNLVGIGIFVAWLALPSTLTVQEDHQRLFAKQETLSLDDVREVLDRHPLDFYGYQLAAEIMHKAGDKTEILVLNHALQLHPTHPGLNLTAARLLADLGHGRQSASEYQIAMRATPDKTRLIAEVVRRFPPELAAQAIPIEDDHPDAMLKVVEDLKHLDVGIAWLHRVLDVRPEDLHACQLLFAYAMRFADLKLVEDANRSCPHYDVPNEIRLQLARVLIARKDGEHAVQALSNVESWQGKVSEKVEGWLVLCDAYISLAKWDDAKRCLRRLDAAGLVPPERTNELTNRLEQIHEQLREQAIGGQGSGVGSGSAPLPAVERR